MIFPVVAPVGTVVVILEAVGVPVIIARVPLNLTMLSIAVVLKLVPVMVTLVPTVPVEGVNELMVGVVVVTVKFEALKAVADPKVTDTFPVEAPFGTVATMDVVVLLVTLAVMPLNLTTLLAGVALKFVPAIVTLVSTAPLVGEKLFMVGLIFPETGTIRLSNPVVAITISPA